MVRHKSVMRHAGIPLGLFSTLLVGLGVASVSQPALAQGPCARIIAACRAAGFVQGAAKTGKGLQVNCVEPIMQGKAAESNSSQPLPVIDPKIVAACKTRNPKFGQPAPPPANPWDLRTDQQHALLPPPADPPAMPTPARPGASTRPNIVFILTDDLSMNLVQFMPHVLKMQQRGITFANYFVTDSLCCPSRSSIFTGRYPHDTGVFKNVGPEGGYLVFHARGNDLSTFATALSAAGYRAAFMGKYLNGYEPEQHHPIPPGWNHWVVAGNGYPELHYVFNQDNQLVHHGRKPQDCFTDDVARPPRDVILNEGKDLSCSGRVFARFT